MLFVGRLEYRKGIDTLLRAWRHVDTDRTLRVVGADVIDYRTNTSISAPLLDGLERVEMLGPQPPERVAQLQREAGVVVVPSPDDNFPFTCIEAMAAGRAVVAANAGGAAEMIEDGSSGLLFEPYDEQGLADALTRALSMSDAERSAMGDAARSRIAELCDPERVINERIEHAALPEAPVARREPMDTGVPIELRGMHAAPDERPPLWRRVLARLRKS